MKFDQKKVTYFMVLMLLGAVIFYGFPPFFQGSGVLAMGLLFFVNPIYCIISNMLYTVKFGLVSFLPVCLAVLALPALFAYFGFAYYYYGIFYAAASFVGCCIGYPIYKRYL